MPIRFSGIPERGGTSSGIRTSACQAHSPQVRASACLLVTSYNCQPSVNLCCAAHVRSCAGGPSVHTHTARPWAHSCLHTRRITVRTHACTCKWQYALFDAHAAGLPCLLLRAPVVDVASTTKVVHITPGLHASRARCGGHVDCQ